MFTLEIQKALKFYVYRLIDPRTGETFYIGKGKGNRVFQHAAAATDFLEDDTYEDAKMKRIREILNSGLDVAHVIHRHGMDEKTALEVEAALIDAYPSTTNIAGGHGNADRGIMHSQEVIERYTMPYAKFTHKVLIVKVNRSATERSLYDAVRYAWRLNKSNAENVDYVVAVINGIIVETYKPTRWLEATTANFPDFDNDREGRIGFQGTVANDTIRSQYNRKRLPEEYRKPGAASPVMYSRT